jgi:hypothetical protein
MKTICQHSGAVITIPGFTHLTVKEFAHPIFSLSFSTLSTLYDDALNNDNAPAENYLLTLALLENTRYCTVKGCSYTEEIGALCTALITKTFSLCTKINLLDSIHGDDLNIPFILIDAANLSNLPYLLNTWDDAIASFLENHATELMREETQALEYKLQSQLNKLKTLQQDKPKTYADNLANWAALASNFPAEFAEQYKQIIIQSCINNETSSFNELLSIDLELLHGLILHCEDNIPHGTLYATTLLRLLRKTRKTLAAYHDLSNMDEDLSPDNEGDFANKRKAALSSFLIIESATNNAAIKNVIDNAPLVKPDLKDYKTHGEYIKAMLSYKVRNKNV